VKFKHNQQVIFNVYDKQRVVAWLCRIVGDYPPGTIHPVGYKTWNKDTWYIIEDEDGNRRMVPEDQLRGV